MREGARRGAERQGGRSNLRLRSAPRLVGPPAAGFAAAPSSLHTHAEQQQVGSRGCPASCIKGTRISSCVASRYLTIVQGSQGQACTASGAGGLGQMHRQMGCERREGAVGEGLVLAGRLVKLVVMTCV